MTQQRTARKKGGFTMVELIVTLVIMGILFAIAVPNLTGYIHLSQFRKNESYAKTMYLSAESSLTYYRTGGEWETFSRKVQREGTLDRQYDADDKKYGRIYGIRLDKGEYAAGDLDGDAALVAELLENDTYDKSVLNAAICIEIDVSTGQVYSVFYGTACDGLYYSSNPTNYVATQADRWQDMDRRDYDTRRAERLGYYSVDDVTNVVNLDMTKLKITSINLVNSETLSLNWSSNSKNMDKDVRYQIRFYNNENKQQLLSMEFKPVELRGSTMSLPVQVGNSAAANYTFPLEYDQANKRFSLTLDAMMNAALQKELESSESAKKASSTSITRFGGELAKPLTIYATIQAFPNEDELNPGDEYQPSTVVTSNTANSMFGDGTNSTSCEVAAFRHLSNIRYMDENETRTFAVTAHALDWNSDSVRVYQTGEHGTLPWLRGSETAFPSIPKLSSKQTLDGNSGLLNRIVSILTGGNTISNLKLDKTSVADGSDYLGLFQKNEGSIINLKLANPSVKLTSSTIKGVGTVCGFSSGSLKDSEVTDADVTVDLAGSANAQGIGGFVGVAEPTDRNSKINNLGTSGSVAGVLPTSSYTRGIGGIIGRLVINRSYPSDLQNEADVTGNRTVGGVVGYAGIRDGATGNKTGQDISNCTNEGLILSSADVGTSAQGHYIGGIVGYAYRTSFGSCTSRAGYADGYQYKAADRSRLRGRYVGGIMGYSDGAAMYNCSTRANGYVLGDSFVGGIIGGTSTTSQQTFLYDTSMGSSTKVTTNASYVVGNSYVGGIIGINTGTSTIENCVNTGVVAGYDNYIGGICGANMSNDAGRPTILNCASYVSDTHNKIYDLVTGWGATGSFAGGLTGYNDGTITFDDKAAVSTRSVAGIVVGKNYVGGVVGYNDVNGTINVRYTLIGGRVRATGDCAGGLVGLNASTELLEQKLTIQPSSVQGRYYVGGAVGANVVNPGTNITVDGLTVNNSLGTITAEAYCGGLIGYQRTYTAANLGGKRLQEALGNGTLLPGIQAGNVPGTAAASLNNNTITITAKDNSGLKTASNNMTIRAYAYAGGIVGYCESQTKMYVKDCLNAGGFERPTLTSSLSSGVDMETYLSTQGYTQAAAALHTELAGSTMRVSIIGGVVGVNGENHVIDHCGNTGTMNGLDAMGGVVGLNEGLVTKCTLSGSMGSATQDCIGGIAGINVGKAAGKTYGSGTNALSYTAGTITNCVTEKNVTVTGKNTVGGIVGYNIGYSDGSRTIGGTVKDNKSSANVSGTGRVGGIAGENGGTIALSAAQQNDSRRVNGTGSGVGGVIGVNTATGHLEVSGGTAGEVIAADSKLTVQGDTKVGGIVGINRGQLGGTSVSLLTSEAQVRASNGGAGGIVGAQEGTGANTRLFWAKNLGRVTANKGAAGGIVAINGTEETASSETAANTVENCIGLGTVTSNDGYAGGVVSENYGTVNKCTVGSDSVKADIISRNVEAAGAICAVNHADSTVSGSTLGSNITISGGASILGAVVGDNYGTVSDTTLSGQPEYDVSANALTVGGAVGRNSAGGTVKNVNVSAKFEKFSKYQYLGGVAGENCAAAAAEDENVTIPAAQVLECSYTGTISEDKSAVGNCYGGIVGLNRGTLEKDTVSELTVTAKGVYTATSTSSAEEKERLSSHIGGIAGKNEQTGTIMQCYIDNKSSSSMEVGSGMVGGVTGYNKGTITQSGDKSTETLMKNVTKVSELLANAKAQNLSADTTWVAWQDNAQVENMRFNGGNALKNGRTMQIIVSSNGNLGGVAGYNAPTGQMDRCVSGSWLLVNKSDSISVGTGGIVGMNESEEDLSFLLNRAFVGRQLSHANTSRFAGGIIGTQSNKTTSDWTIENCINYGTVYGYLSHYSGGIVGQWTNNGGSVENCYNYGNLQTTMAIGWVGASGGIVAQLYHAASGQDFNILSCQNHGNLYGRDGNGQNRDNKANDSAGILGNVTAYRADNGGGQAFTINVVDCVNGPGVEIYSASMASGIVGFFSTDGIGSNEGNNTACPKIGKATENIVLNIDRCRNYAKMLYGANFAAGILGDRYEKTNDGTYNVASKNTYLQNCFSVSSGTSNVNDQAIASLNNYQWVGSVKYSYSAVPQAERMGNNYYVNDSWGLTGGTEALTSSNRGESRFAYSRMMAYGQLNKPTDSKIDTDSNNTVFAAAAGPALAPLNDKQNSNYKLYYNMRDSNTSVDAHGIMTSTISGSQQITGRVLFYMPKSWSVLNNYQFVNWVKNGTLPMDTYVRSNYRDMEHDQTGKKLDASFKVDLTQQTDGSFDVSISDDDRPLYYKGEVYVAGQDEPVLTNLRFIPRQKGQGQWDPNLTGAQSYGSGITTGTFQLPESLAADTAGKTITLKVRAVSLFEDTAPSKEVSVSTSNVAVLPQPDVQIRLVNHWNGGAAYEYSLRNYDDYAVFKDWQVTFKLGSQSQSINSTNRTIRIDGSGLSELIVTASAGTQDNGSRPATITDTIPTYTPKYKPDGSISRLDVSYSGNTVEDFTITAGLSVRESTMETPPIYRIEVVGSIGTQEYVFAYEDVLTSAGNVVTANFRNLPEEYFSDKVSGRRVRAWYAASGLGPVYTYGDTPVSGEQAITLRNADGTTGKTVYSYVLGHKSAFSGYYTETWMNDIKPLAAPVLSEPEKIVENGSMSYKFSWTQPNLNRTDPTPQYTVKLTGITANGARIGIPTSEVYTRNTDTSFTINADDWHYTKVELVVTRMGLNNGEVGLSATGTYDVQQRLERPGQPSVTNADTNELVYTIGWSAISDQTGCGRYRIYVQPQNGTVAELGDAVPTDSTASHYSVERNLEDYAGQTITIYLVAEAADGSGYANSPNGISYTMTVPTRINQPQISWKYSWDGTATTVSASDFASGGLTVTVTPKDGTNSVPPGGSTYLLRATIIDADGSTVEYPADGDVLAMAENGKSYICNLTDLSTKYAGCKVTFEARISQSAGQVSSAWVKSGQTTFPKVRLPQPSVTTASYTRPLTVMYGATPQNMESRDWTAQLTTLSWPEVENADTYEVTLTNADDSQTVVRVDLRNTPKIEVKQGSSWKTIAVEADDWYTVTQGSAITENYSNASGSTRWFRYTLDTRLTVDGKTITLCLPNAFSMTTHEAQTLQMNKVQVKNVQITAQSDAADRYDTSEAAKREF